MTTLRQRYDARFAGRKGRASEQAATPIVLALADACDAAIAMGRLADEHVALMLAALAGKASMVWGNAKEMVGWLQVAGVDTAPIVRTMFAHKRAKIRVLALHCLTSGAAQNTLVDDLLLAALSDPDAWATAADIATVRFRKRWLVRHMDAAAKSSKGVAYYQQLLARGFVANRMPDGTHWLEVLISTGGIRRRTVSDEDMATRGIAAIVEELRQPDDLTVVRGERALPVEDGRIFDETCPNPLHQVSPLYRTPHPA